MLPLIIAAGVAGIAGATIGAILKEVTAKPQPPPRPQPVYVPVPRERRAPARRRPDPELVLRAKEAHWRHQEEMARLHLERKRLAHLQHLVQVERRRLKEAQPRPQLPWQKKKKKKKNRAHQWPAHHQSNGRYLQ